MIIYFSGNGNSRHVALSVADICNDSNIVEINRHLLDKGTLQISESDDRIVWVVPVHAWGLPIAVKKFLSNIIISDKTQPHYLIVTCGDDTGYIDKEWRELMTNAGLHTMGCWNIIMPNTFVTLPGFDVDNDKLERQKLSAAGDRIRYIAHKILSGSQETDLFRGNFPHIKSALLRPAFIKWCMSVTPFHSNDRCTSCGLCARVCPLSNIKLVEGHPVWDTDCTFCLGCYNHCPHHAIEYGRATVHKGQYHFPSSDK